MTEPHYLRFARTLALASGIAGAASGCGMSTTPGNDTGTGVADAGGVDAFFDCASCTCGLTATDAGVPFCSGDAVITCGCAAVGPLAPPDLAAA
jgi:hypothetical protein